MSTPTDITRLVEAWLKEGPPKPASLRDSVLQAAATTSQRRHRWWPYRRPSAVARTFPRRELTPAPVPATNGPAPASGFTMFSALKFVTAAAIVALFGGFLLSGVLITQSEDEMVPAAVTAVPESTPTAESSLRITFKPTDDPAVFEVVSQPHKKWLHERWQDRRLLGPLAIGSGESPWVQGWDTGGRAFLAEVGVPGRTKLWTTDDLAITPDGTLWAAGMKHNQGEDRVLAFFDGQEWTVRPTDQPVVDLTLAADGTLYGITAGMELLIITDGDVTTRILEPPPTIDMVLDGEVVGSNTPTPLALAVTPDGVVWVGGRGGGSGIFTGRERGSLVRYEDQSPEVIRPLGDGIDPYVAGLSVGPDGDLWALMRTENDSYLGRFDGQDWTIYSTADGLPPVATGFFAHDVDRLAVAPDGRVWLSDIANAEDEAPRGGLVVFDGQDFTRYLPGSWVADFAIAPDGSVWTTDSLDKGIHVIRPDEATTAE